MFLPLDAADSADIPRAPGYLSVGRPMVLSEGIQAGKGPFGSRRPSFALFSKYLNSDILYK